MNPEDKQQRQSSSSHSQSSGDSSKRKESHILIDPLRYRPFIDDVKTRNLNTPEMLTASVNNIIRPEDSIIYTPKNLQMLPTKYPVYPLGLNQTMLEKFNDETLFFIFYIQQDYAAKEMVLRQLQKKGWMYNTKYNMFFQLQGEPKSKTNEYIEGKFRYFEYERDWMIKLKQDYKLELKYLEKEKS
jgi:CCR4-NOT transcriptional regulation complex NOT5 subunit